MSIFWFRGKVWRTTVYQTWKECSGKRVPAEECLVCCVDVVTVTKNLTDQLAWLRKRHGRQDFLNEGRGVLGRRRRKAFCQEMDLTDLGS